jgi:hypothetical protein
MSAPKDAGRVTTGNDVRIKRRLKRIDLPRWSKHSQKAFRKTLRTEGVYGSMCRQAPR